MPFVQQTQVVQNPKVSYIDLLNVILQKQLIDHLSYLSSFMTLFAEADSDRNGIIDSEAFVLMYKRMNINETDANFELLP
mgnify:CR=1 FL=1